MQSLKFSLTWATWQFLAVLLLLLAPSQLWLGEPVWAIEPDRAAQLLGLPVAYLVAVFVTALVFLARRGVRAPVVLGVFATALAGYLLFLLLVDAWYSRGVLLFGSSVFLGLALLPFLHRRLLVPGTLLLVPAALVLGGLGIATSMSERGETDVLPERSVTRSSLYHTLEIDYLRHVEPTIDGGGIDRLGDDFLLVTGEGDFFRYAFVGDSLVADRLPLQVPINRSEFSEAADEDIVTEWFRVAGLLTQEVEGGIRAVVSHHVWHGDQSCYALRFSDIVFDPDEILAGTREASGWRTLHETRPCLPIRDRGNRFAGLEAGGRIAPLGDTALIVSVGDHEFDGWNSDEALAQDPESDYGKTLILPLDGSDPWLFTLGHRNPQGLHVAPNGEIWLSEHGPRHGDELNRLVEGGNYGWPYETHGTEYGELSWPLSGLVGPEDGFVGPEHAWVPSIAPSNLISLEEGGFPAWEDDLILSSLQAQSLFRIRLDEGRVVYAESILVGRRVRDLVEGRDGRILLWGDGGWLASVTVSPDSAEESLVRLCTACHSVEGGEGHGLGPNLAGVFGAEVGSRSGFAYSEALSALGGVWTEERLDAFLRDPVGFAPGTTMIVAGVEDDEERRFLVEYLRDLGD